MTDSLFDKIGGKDSVNLAVDLFYNKIMENARINHFLKILTWISSEQSKKYF